MHRAIAIIPVFNEEERISDVVGGVRLVGGVAEVVVIDDGSTDATAARAEAAGAKVLHHCFNLGYGVALQTGYKYALEHGFDHLVQLDGDGQHDPADIPRLLDALVFGDADMAVGSRFLKETPRAETLPHSYRAGSVKMLGIRAFALLATLLTGLRLTDPTSGYQALNRRVMRFCANDFFPADYPDADLMVMVAKAGFRIKEVPVTVYERQGGQSMHSGLKPLYYVFKMLLSLLMTLLRARPDASSSE